jgi:hypothetical protein
MITEMTQALKTQGPSCSDDEDKDGFRLTGIIDCSLLVSSKVTLDVEFCEVLNPHLLTVSALDRSVSSSRKIDAIPR